MNYWYGNLKWELAATHIHYFQANCNMVSVILWILFSDLEVSNITGMRYITLLITWLTSLSGMFTQKQLSFKVVKRREKNSITHQSSTICRFFSHSQSSAADVFYCIFNGREDSHGTNRRQVAHLNVFMIHYVCHFCAVSFSFNLC